MIQCLSKATSECGRRLQVTPSRSERGTRLVVMGHRDGRKLRIHQNETRCRVQPVHSLERGQCWDACERRIHRNKTNCLSAYRRRSHWNVDDGMPMYVASTGTSMCWDACIRRIHRNGVKCLSAHRRRTHRNVDDGMSLYVTSTGTLMPGLTGTSSRN